MRTRGTVRLPVEQRRVASSPSTFGMRTSIRITSGSSSAARLERLGAVGGLADDLDVLLGLEDHPEPRADERLVVDDEHADHRARLGERQARPDDVAAAVAPAALDLAAVQRDALAHPGEPVSAAVPSPSPRPSFAISSSSSSSPQPTETQACAGPAYLSAFVSASWTTR